MSNQHLHIWLDKYITFIKTKLFRPLHSATPERSCLLPSAGCWRVRWPQGLEVRGWFRIEACGEKFQDSDSKASTLWRRKEKKGKEKKKLLFLKKKKEISYKNRSICKTISQPGGSTSHFLSDKGEALEGRIQPIL